MRTEIIGGARRSAARRVPTWALVILLPALLAADVRRAAAADPETDYRTEIDGWHQRRLASLTSENGWLTLVGLTWLEEGRNRLGSAPENEVVFPVEKAPPRIGEILVEGDRPRFRIAPGIEVLHEGAPVEGLELISDARGAPTLLELGDLSFHLIDRDGRLAVRIRDRSHPARTEFPGIDTYPVDPSWRVRARLEPHDPPRTVPIPTVLGTISEQASPGSLVFERGGETYRLDALGEEGAEELFIIFADATTGRETYGGGRYVYAPIAADGTVDLDFNKAYNPPCAFTAFATCPLPPRQNRLALRVEAGEKKYSGDH